MSFQKRGILVSLFMSIVFFGYASKTEEKYHEENPVHEKFEPGPFIMDHILDSYDWHIATIGKKHISIPLPIILYSEYSGFHIFMSSKFHHGHSAYKNFEIAHDGEHKGRIIELLNNHSEYLLFDFSITKN